MSRKLPPVLKLLLIGSATLASLAVVRAAEGPISTAIASVVSKDYVRSKFPNGSFQPETYSFGLGGYWSGGTSDKSIDGHPFMDVAKVIARPLQLQNYIPTKDAKTTKLLIMVYWGTTIPPRPANGTIAFQTAGSALAALQRAKSIGSSNSTASSAIKAARGSVPGPPDEENAATSAMMALQAENAMRRRIDVRNARMLGYDSLWDSTAKLEGTPLDTRRNDMLDELEDGRYFVVLMAYDFQLMWKEKKHKLLWETRFSISGRGHEFNKELAAMAKSASRYFGQDSHGLVRKPLQENVTLGELKILGVEPDKK